MKFFSWLGDGAVRRHRKAATSAAQAQRADDGKCLYTAALA
jgi:hypothetical protein